MGRVAVVLKVMPQGVDTDLAALQKAIEGAIPDAAKLQGVEEKPVAFGLKALSVTVVMEDAEGGPDAVEEAIAGLDGVESVQVTDMGRLL